MAVFSLEDAEIYVDDFDATSHTNTVNLEVMAEPLEVTTFGSGGAKERILGLRDLALSVSGWRDTSATVDTAVYENLGAQRVFTVSPTATAGEVAYMGRLRQFSYTPGGSIGEAAQFSANGQGSSGLGIVRGQLLFPRGAVTGAANGTGFQMGAVAADESVYITVHCFTAGTTADVIVESDDNSGFSSATTRATVEVTAVGGTWVTPVAGAITDDYWRVRFADVTGSFSIAVAVAIQ